MVIFKMLQNLRIRYKKGKNYIYLVEVKLETLKVVNTVNWGLLGGILNLKLE